MKYCFQLLLFLFCFFVFFAKYIPYDFCIELDEFMCTLVVRQDHRFKISHPKPQFKDIFLSFYLEWLYEDLFATITFL